MTLRIGGIFHRDVNRDEQFTLERIQHQQPGELIDNLGRTGRKQTAYYLLMHQLTRVLPRDLGTIRATSVVAGTLSVLAIFLLGRALFDTATGILSAALLTVSPYHLYYSAIGRVYAIVVLLTICSTHALVTTIENRERRFRRASIYMLSAASLMYLHYFGMIVVGLQICIMMACARRYGTGKLGLVCAVGLTALYAPLVPSLLADAVDDHGMQFIKPPAHPKEILIAPAVYLQSFVPPTLGGGLLSMAICAFALGAREARQRTAVAALAVCALAPILFSYAWSVTSRPIWMLRYTIISLPPLLLVLAFAARRIVPEGRAYLVALLFAAWHVVAFAGESRGPWAPRAVHEEAFRQ